MKIGNSVDTQALPSAAPAVDNSRAVPADTGKAQGTPPVSGGSSTEASATVALSSTASSLRGVNGTNAEFDADKVARISQAIADGSFQVNPEAIADKLIANAQELLNQTAR